jgi:hypothetical protein
MDRAYAQMAISGDPSTFEVDYTLYLPRAEVDRFLRNVNQVLVNDPGRWPGRRRLLC